MNKPADPIEQAKEQWERDRLAAKTSEEARLADEKRAAAERKAWDDRQ